MTSFDLLSDLKLSFETNRLILEASYCLQMWGTGHIATKTLAAFVKYERQVLNPDLTWG